MPRVLVNRSQLNEALDFVKNVVPDKPIISADGNISIVFDGSSTLQVIATDGIQGARALVDVSTDGTVESFSLGCDPKRLIKIVAKDTSDIVTLEKNDPHLVVGSAMDDPDKFATLVLANMRRASTMMAWSPSDPTTDVVLDTGFLVEAMTFLDDFLPDGKDEGAKHAVVVLSNKLAHATNGVDLRGICASPHLGFTSDVSLRKKYLTNAIRAIKFVNSDSLRFLSNVRQICITSPDGRRALVMPTTRKKPPVVPLEYLKDMGDYFQMDIREAVRGIDRISSSNYNTASTLTGVDLFLEGGPEDSKLKMTLDADKASQTFPVRRSGGPDMERCLSVKTLHKMLKMFQKSKESRIYMGESDTRYIRFFDKREVNGIAGAFVAVCAYLRKV